MTDTLICITWLITCIIAIECYCESKQRGRGDQQFFAVCMGVLLAVFGLGRWL